MIIGTFKTQAKDYAGNLITLTHRGKLRFTAADKGGHHGNARHVPDRAGKLHAINRVLMRS
jgi:hypothetical protein